MKRFLTIAVVMAAMVLTATVVVADVPHLINYQGYLTDAVGEPLDGAMPMVFTIYDTPTGSPGIWYSGSQLVNVENGRFTYQLGSVNQLPDDLFADTVRWLGIRVGSDPEIAPRTRLVTVPYAYRVASLEGAGGGVINGSLGVLGDGSKLGSNPNRHTAEPPILFSPFIGAGWPAGFNPPSPPRTGFIHVYDAAGNNVIDLDGSTGRVGIGTSGPEAMLQVEGAVFMLGGTGDADLDGGVLAPDLVLMVDYLTLGTLLAPGEFAEADIDGDGRVTWDDAAILTRILFQAESKAQAVRNINSSYGAFSTGGDVFYVRGWAGIGTTTPTVELDVVGDIHASGTITSGSSITIDGTNHEITSTSGMISFVDEDLVTIGDVGIGTLSPEAKLHVDGNVFLLGGNGDADLSGSVNAVDLARIVNYLNQTVFLTPSEYAEADMDGDGRVTWDDLAILNRFLFQGDSKTQAVRNINGSYGAMSSPTDGFYVRGDVGIGIASPSQKLHVVGNICYTGTIGACSDARYKKGVTTLSNSLSQVLQLRGVRYEWKQDEFPSQNFDDKTHLGFIAQEVEQFFPEMVMTDNNGYKSVDYGRLTPVLVEAIKELKAENDDKNARIEKLTAQLAHLSKSVESIQARLNDGDRPTVAVKR